MEKTAIQKINKLGRAGHIICKIAKVVVIIAAVLILLAGIVMFILPQDFIQVRMDNHADIVIDYSHTNIDLESMTKAELDEFMHQEDLQASFEIDDMEFGIDNLFVDGSKVHLSGNAHAHTFNVQNLRLVMILALLYTITAYIGTHFLSDLCKAISLCQTPFEDSVIKKMWRFAVALIPISLIGGNLNGIVQILMTGNGTIGFTMDLEMVVAVLLLFALVYIFKYGAQLQQESDETL